VTSPPAEFTGDIRLAFSPDRRSLVFARMRSGIGTDAYILPLANGTAKREPWQLTNELSRIDGFAWTPDSREIVFSSDHGGRRGLWRVSASPGKDPERIPGTDDGVYPTISKGSPIRLAYQRSYSDTNIWRMEIPASTNRKTSATQIIASSAMERDPQFSSDGTRIAFTSERSGYPEIWLAGSDGSNPAQLTSFAGTRTAGAPNWSPDGRQIAFDRLAGGNIDIFVINLENWVCRPLTNDHGNSARPSWSRDGRWIYFGSNRSGKPPQVWKIQAEGGNARQITKNGGFEAAEAPDGKVLYYAKIYAVTPGVWSVPVEGGEEVPIIDSARMGHWAVTDKGIYFLDFSAVPTAEPKPLKLFSFETGRVSQVGTIEKIMPTSNASFSVSRDGRWVIWRQVDRSESNIMLINNFR
jgi:Tol biopolymer transport system component